MVAATFIAGEARTETAAAAKPDVAASRPVGETSDARALLAAAYARTNTATVSMSPTAVDHRFGLDDLVGSVGFLCGLYPSLSETGSAVAHGWDPHGRFVGAKLSYAFK